MGKQDRTAVVPRLDPEVAQWFYTLRDRLLGGMERAARPGRIFVVSSCHRKAGVSTVAVKFTVALSEGQGSSVLLCDANIDSPGLNLLLGLDSGPGLVDVLAGQADLKDAACATDIAGLQVLTSGRRLANPSEIVESPRFRDLMGALRNQYAFAIIDAPPILDSSATVRIAAASDGIILVIEAERDRWEAAAKATDLLKSARAEVLGVVLNKRRLHIPGFLYQRL